MLGTSRGSGRSPFCLQADIAAQWRSDCFPGTSIPLPPRSARSETASPASPRSDRRGGSTRRTRSPSTASTHHTTAGARRSRPERPSKTRAPSITWTAPNLRARRSTLRRYPASRIRRSSSIANGRARCSCIGGLALWSQCIWGRVRCHLRRFRRSYQSASCLRVHPYTRIQ